jgi:sulfur-oxidizing protein SoxZ
MTTDDKRVQITTTRDGARTLVRMVFPVQTDAGRRASASSRAVPARFVQTVSVERGGTAVFVAHLGANMARTPEVSFDLEGVSLGTRLTLRWIESGQSASYEQEFEVT